MRHCTWLGYRPPRPVGETGGRYHLGESLLSGRLQSMCDIVLGVEIERALRAIQRDEGWNCKGAHSATIAIPGLGE